MLAGLLLVPALIAGSLYLARGPGSAAAPSARGTVASVQTTQGCGSSRAGPCAEASPAAISTASAPRSAPPARTGGHAIRPKPSPSVSPTRSGTKQPILSIPSTSASAVPAVSTTAAATPTTPATQVLTLVNAARASAGLPPLTITTGLVRSASAHNALMAAGCGLSHQCPGEPGLGTRETDAGVSWTAAGENIGAGGPAAASTAAITHMAVTLTQDMLDEQPPNDGHRKNILSATFTHIGIAITRDSSGTVWLTQDFST